MKTANIYYVHSGITFEMAQNTASEHDGENYYITARKYKPPIDTIFHLNQDHIPTIHHLLSIAVDFDRELKKIQQTCENINLYLPHSLLPLFRVFAAHNKVSEVYFLEEGDAAFQDFFDNELVDRMQFPENISNQISVTLEKLGYNKEHIRISLEKSPRTHFYNLHDKIQGVVCSNECSFPGFTGRKKIYQLKTRFRFNKNSALLILPDVKYSPAMNSICKNRESIEKKLNSISETLVFFKAHPSCSLKDYPDWLKKYFESFKNWETCPELSEKRHLEPALFKFDTAIALFGSSSIQYLKRCDPNILTYLIS